LPHVVNSQLTTVACRSHPVSRFVNSMMTGCDCDATHHAVHWCQPRLAYYKNISTKLQMLLKVLC